VSSHTASRRGPSPCTTWRCDRPLPLDSGCVLGEVTLAYESWGELNPMRDNAVLVCHALTGDSHVTSHTADDRTGWWEQLIGPGRAIDPNRDFVVCANCLGSCYGSTGPASLDPATGRPRPIPYTYGYIRMDGADNIFSHLIDETDATRLQVGMRLRAVFKPAAEMTGDIRDIRHFEVIGR